LANNYIYVGLTNNIKRRLNQHNAGRARATQYYRPFRLIFSEPFEIRIKARGKEKYLKSGVGKEFLKKIV